MFVIAGVTGHVGGVAASKLIAERQKVKVIVRSAAKGADWAVQGAELAVGELEDAAFLAGALRGSSGFFTLLPPNYQATDFLETQHRTADAIASAVRASGVPHVVLLSSVGADLSSGTGPIRGLHYFENELRKTGTKLTAIRASYFQENVANSLGPAKQLGIFPNFSASADYPFPMVATQDIGELVAHTLLAPPTASEVVDLVGPSYSIRQVAEKLGAALNKPLHVVDVPQADWVKTLMQSGMPQPLAELFAEMYQGFSSGAIRPKGDRVVYGQTPIDDVIRAAAR